MDRTGKQDNREVSVDPTRVSSGEQYRREQDKHPLYPIGYPYAEWKTTDCIIALDEGDFWDKRLIGLIQQSGALRVQCHDHEINLKPVAQKRIQAGSWNNTYQHDTIQITINATFEDKHLKDCLTGLGKMTGKIGTIPIEEPVYLVYTLKHLK
jgi:hypothetical protein